MLSYPWWLNNTPRIPILRKWDFLSAAAEGAREGEFPRNGGRASLRASPLGNPGGGHGGLLPPAREDPGDQLYNNLQMRPFTLFQLLQLRVQGHFQQRLFSDALVSSNFDQLLQMLHMIFKACELDFKQFKPGNSFNLQWKSVTWCLVLGPETN